MRRTSSSSVAFSLLLAAVTLGGCENLWSWTANDQSFEAQFERGREALRRRDYASAEESLTRAVAMRPQNNEARYYLAKATVLQSGIDVLSLIRTVTDSGQNGAAEIFAYQTPDADAVYRVNASVLDALEPVRMGTAPEGQFTANDVNLDVGVAYALRAILRLRDTNGDGRIDAQDLPVDAFSLVQDGGFSLDGLQNVPPDDLNTMITDLSGLAGGGGDALVDALSGSGIDVAQLGDLLGSLNGDVSAYYVNTGVPGNPGLGDNDHDGLTDEECLNGVDDDGDGRVDEDARVAGCP
ncbi:MAG: hypothetical protein U0167_09295 [bacterium]